MRENARNLLSSYVEARYPIIYIDHFDFQVIDEIIAGIADGRTIVEYNNGLGIVQFQGKAPVQECDLRQFLHYVKDDGYEQELVIVLKDIHSQLDDPDVISLLKYIAIRNMYYEGYDATVFIVSSKRHIPEELEEYVTLFDVPLPTVRDIKIIIRGFVDDLNLKPAEGVLGELAISFKGLNEFQIRQILNLAYQDGGTIDIEDRELIRRQKEQYIKKAGLLESIPVKESIDDIGGLENLKKWLHRKEKIVKNLEQAINFGVDIPKGILIVGMPGCGKSLAAKATAQLFSFPLVRLDIGRLMGKYVGESEENMRKALRLAEAISPCVLWVDEIEKAFSGIGASGGGGDVTTRLFGQFLTWMQEKENTVFIVATANNISKLPPEFLRKGRFDELFYVDLPNNQERRKILEIHLRKRHKWNKDLDLTSICKETEGYSGADLEALVKEAVENCFIDEGGDGAGRRKRMETEDLKKAQKSIKSISVTLREQIKQIRDAVKQMNLKPASDPDNWVAAR